MLLLQKSLLNYTALIVHSITTQEQMRVGKSRRRKTASRIVQTLAQFLYHRCEFLFPVRRIMRQCKTVILK